MWRAPPGARTPSEPGGAHPMETRPRRIEEPWRHPRWVYRRRAITHIAQTGVAAIPLAIGALTLSLASAILFFLAAELIVLLLLPNLAGFRRRVDATIEGAVCEHAALTRAELLGRMDEKHRRELDQLE